ncbi:hypothetical protein BOX15_Mlig000085g2, partial [Macrostomum lignano]
SMSDHASSSDLTAAASSDEVSQHQEAMRTLLIRLHKQLVRRDVNGIFAKPVTDDIAPRYSEIITNPMDLSTIRSKIDSNQYANVADFRGDFRLMCQNAMTYNTPDTIFYEEADKLMTEGDRLMAFDKLIQLRKQCGLANRLSDEDLQAASGRPRRHPAQQLLAKASPKSSPRSAAVGGSGGSGNRRRPAAALTPPPTASSSSATAAAEIGVSSAGGASRPASNSVPDDIFDSVVGVGEASNSGASHCSGGAGASSARSLAADSTGGLGLAGGADADGECSGNSSSNMMVLMEEEGSEAGQIEIEELIADEDEADDDRPGAPASYTDPTPVGELTALAEAAAAEARARLMSAGPPLIGRLEEPGLVFVPLDDYEDDFYSSSGVAAAPTDVKRLCRRQVFYPTDAAQLLGLQDSEQAALDQMTSRLLPAAGGPLLAAASGTGDRVDAFLADEAASADLLGEVYGDRLALEYVLSVQTYIAGCSRGQRRLVNKYFNLVTEGDHKRCEPIWRQYQRRQRRHRRIQQRRRLGGDFKEEIDQDDDNDDDEDEEEEEDQEDDKNGEDGGDGKDKDSEQRDGEGEAKAKAEDCNGAEAKAELKAEPSELSTAAAFVAEDKKQSPK